MEENKAQAQVQLSAYAELASRLNQLNSAMNELNSPEKFQQMAAESSQPQLFTAQADHLKIDGIESRSSTNTFANVVSGVSINVTAGADALPAEQRTGNLNVDQDKQAIKDNIDAFVMAYNDVIIHLNFAKSASQQQDSIEESHVGALAGEGAVRSIENQLRSELFTPTGGEPENMLAMIGIETYVESSYGPDNPNPQNGTLQIDSEKLDEALDEDLDRVAYIIGDPEEGYAARFADLAASMTRTTVVEGQLQKGVIEARTEGLNNEINRIDDRIESQLRRLDQMEARLYRQFAAADAMAANMNSTGMFLEQQMAGLPGYIR